MLFFLYILIIALIIYVVILGNKVHWLEKQMKERDIKRKEVDESKAERKYRPLEQLKKVHEVSEKQVIKKQKKQVRLNFSMASVLSKMGIALVLIGIGFLFKWGYDQGFITEFITVIFGVIIGWGLIAFGRIAYNKKRDLVSQVVYGGGIATLYITVYGAYAVYEMLNDILAFLFLILVSLIAFYISLTHQKLSLSITALLGSLIIPLLVDVQFIGFFGFGLYLVSLAVFNGFIFYYKRWRSLQLLTIIGIYSVLFIVTSQVLLSDQEKTELGVLFFILYAIFNGQDLVMAFKKRLKEKDLWTTSVLLIIIPLFTILLTKNLLDWSVNGWTLLFAGLALAYFAGSYVYFKIQGEDIINNSTLVMMATFIYFGIIQFFEGRIEWMILIIMAHVFFFFYQRRKAVVFQWIGHGVSLIAWVTLIINSLDRFDEFAYSFEYIGSSVIIYILFIGVLYWQKAWIRKIYSSGTFFGYGTLFNAYYANHLMDEGYRLFAFAVLTFAMIGILWFVNRKKTLFFSYTLPAYGFILFLIRLAVTWDFVLEREGFWIYSLMLMGIIIFIIGVFMRKKVQSEGYLYEILGSLIILWGAFVDTIDLTQEVIYGLFALGLAITLIELIIWYAFKKNDILILVYRGIFFTIYLFGLTYQVFDYAFEWIKFVAEIGVLLIFVWHLYRTSKKQILNYLIISGVFYLYTYGAFREVATGLVTLFWAAMGVGGLIYGIIKRNQHFSYVALGLVVFVAGRLVLIDLASVEVYWKVITSMVFGGALLAISYFLQPYFEKD